MRVLWGVLAAAVLLVSCGNGGGGDEEPSASPATAEAGVQLASDGGSAAAEGQRSITVGGIGAEYAAPVRSVVNLAVSARRDSVLEATEAAARAAASIVSEAEAAGVPQSGIQTSEFNIWPVFGDYEIAQIVAYEVTLGYNVTFTSVDDVGSVLAKVISAGGDSVRAYGLRFEADHAALMDDARAEAWQDAKARAESTAELAGETLGPVLDAHEKVLITTPQGFSPGGEGDTAAFDVPIAPGASGVTILLTVTYAIGP